MLLAAYAFGRVFARQPCSGRNRKRGSPRLDAFSLDVMIRISRSTAFRHPRERLASKERLHHLTNQGAANFLSPTVGYVSILDGVPPKLVTPFSSLKAAR